MVGTDPTAASKTTIIPTEIVPFKLTFSNGITLDGTKRVKTVEESPLFKTAKFSSGTTQYGDAIQRAEFWKIVSENSPKYHVLLGKPAIHETVSIDVPANVGTTVVDPNTGQLIGLVNFDWLDAQIQSLIISLDISPKKLPIFLVENTFAALSGGEYAAGYHSAFVTSNAGKTQLYTYTFAAYETDGNDILALSHEISEWFNDPFGDNVVPTWSVGNSYSCSPLLETGDPVNGVGFEVKGYHLQDEAFFSWFAKQPQSLGINGLYTYLGTLSAPSPTC